MGVSREILGRKMPAIPSEDSSQLSRHRRLGCEGLFKKMSGILCDDRANLGGIHEEILHGLNHQFAIVRHSWSRAFPTS